MPRLPEVDIRPYYLTIFHLFKKIVAVCYQRIFKGFYQEVFLFIALGQYLCKNKIHLIYGGGNFGLMGILAEEVLKCGGEVTGFLPEFFSTLKGNFNEREIIIIIKQVFNY